MKINFLSVYLFTSVLTLILAGCTHYEKIPQSTYTLKEPFVSDTGISFIDIDRFTVYKGGAAIKPSSIDWNVPIHTVSPIDDVLYNRPFYALVSKHNNDTLFISNRHISFEKTLNFRDLGGIKTKDNRQIKWGKIYRSGKLDKIKKSEIVILENMKISRVIDLRTDGEVKDHPDKIPDNSNISWVHIPITGVTYEDLEQTKKDIRKQDPDEFDGNGKMEEAMHLFTKKGKMDFKRVFDELTHLSPDSAIVYHCTAGKDRTGLMTALILHVLGVDQETIMNEYLLSNYYRYNKMERNARLGALLGIENESLRPIMEVRPSYLKTSYQLMRDQYGSIDGYMQSMGITKEYINTLRNKYLY